MRRLPYISQQLPAFSPLSSAALAQSSVALLRRAQFSQKKLRCLISDRFAADNVILFDSGRSALQTAIRVAAAQASSEDVTTVALPAFQCYEVASAAIGSGARICFYDIDPETLGPDFDSLQKALADGANIVVVAPLYGIPVDWDETSALAARYGAIIIEDAAQGFGASWRGRRLGTLGSFSVLSFGRGKGWTGGRGGALCLRGLADCTLPTSPSVQHFATELRVAAATWAQWFAGRPAVYGIPARLPWLELGETQYREPTLPVAMTRFAAELLLRSANAADDEGRALRARADLWRRRFAMHKDVRLVSASNVGTAGYLRFPVRAVTPAAHRAMNGSAARRLGIARSYPLPLDQLPAVAAMKRDARREYPGAQSLAHDLFTLPTHSFVTTNDCHDIERLLWSL